MTRASRHFTIIVVPHAEGRTLHFRLPLALVQTVAALMVAFWLVLMIGAVSYYDLQAGVAELEELRLVNQQQKAEIQILARSAATLEQNLAYLRELDYQVRELADLTPEPAAASVAEADVSVKDRQTEQFTVAAFPGWAQGGGTDLTTVDTSALQDAASVRQHLDSMQSEIARREQSLEGLRVALAERQAYMAACPSIWPVRGIITSRFGWRRSPIGWGREYHKGLDIAGRYGIPIVATGEGRVTSAGWKGNYGRTVIIKHNYGFTTLYGHCSRLAVSVGQQVKKGQVIGYVGSTGRSTGPHVHYEVHVNGRPVDPERYLKAPD